MQNTTPKKLAFTLIELAIVIVIIGLVVGGVLGAQSLIKSSEINSEISDIRKMQTAIKAFKLEFDGIPGDMPDAYDYFGDDCGTDSTHTSQGCNGDDDRCLDQSTGTSCSTGGAGYGGDFRRSMTHLRVSGIYPELPQTMNVSFSSCSEILASSKLNKFAVRVLHSETSGKIYLHYFISSTINSVCDLNGQVGYLVPRDARKIDRKVDDGNGRRGIYRAMVNHINEGAYEGTDCMDSDGNYALSEEDTNCATRIEID